MIVPLPQSGQGCPANASGLSTEEAIEADTVASGVSTFVLSVTFVSDFGFFSFGALGFRSRYFGSFFAFSSAWAATAS